MHWSNQEQLKEAIKKDEYNTAFPETQTQLSINSSVLALASLSSGLCSSLASSR